MQIGKDFRRRLEAVLRCPTAPFHEANVHRVILDAVAASPRLRAKADVHGNLEVTYGPGRSPLLFACHTDHPALEARGDGTAAIRGGIRPKALRGARLRHLDGTPARARAGAVVPDGRPGIVQVEGGRFRRGTPLVLDLPAPTLGAKIRARAIDDLLAVAACLAMFDRLAAARWKGSVGALFTRAEEVGFAGALGWVKTTRTARATTIVNLEMSSARPHTPQGNGPILRVGDRITCFSQEVSAELEVTAAALAKKDKDFRWQRALMDGGACEATVYADAGFRTGALCLPLMNYHNHAPEGGVTREYVSAADAENLVRWMTAYARGFRSVDGRSGYGRRLDRLWQENRKALAETAREANR
ncbi:MAG TPA: M28 family peptidase [Planctomycetota bacterium]|nr:M28 family peptidase [Planctomycetota bacterium]